MPSIGDVTCDLLRGNAGGLVATGEFVHPPGRDGYFAQQQGKGEGAWRFEAVLYASSADVETWITALEALAWTVVSATDDHDVTHTNLMVERAVLASREARRYAGSSCVRGVVTLEGVVIA